MLRKEGLTKKAVLLAPFLLLAPWSARADWGGSFSLGHWRADVDDISRDADHFNRDPGFSAPKTTEIKKEWLIPEVGVFYEKELLPRLFLGGELAFGLPPTSEEKVKYKVLVPYDTSFRMKNEAEVLNLSIYAKRKFKNQRFSVNGGVGADYFMAHSQLTAGDQPDDSAWGKFEQNKLAWHLACGTEYAITPRISIGIGAKYIFSAVLDDFRGGLSSNFFTPPPEDHRLVMQNNPPYGESIGAVPASQALAANQRPYKIDFGGLRLNLLVRYYWGSLMGGGKG